MPIIDVEGATLDYSELGNRDNPTIVLTATVLFGVRMFDDLAPKLADNYHIVLINLHGHGESGYRTPMTLEDMTNDCHSMLIKLGLTKVTWFGHSIGGMIGMRMALMHPEVIDSLVLIATSAGPDPTGLRFLGGQLWDQFLAGERETIVDAALELFLSPVTFVEQPELARHFRDLIFEVKNPEGVYAANQAVINRGDITEEIAAINVPTLVLAGRHDFSACSPPESMLIAARIPGAQVAIIDDAGHSLISEKPDETDPIIYQFLAETRAIRS